MTLQTRFEDNVTNVNRNELALNGSFDEQKL